MMVIIVPAAVGQSEAGGVRAGHTVSFSLAAQAEQLSVALSRGRCCYTTPALFHLLLIQTRKLPVLSRLLYKLLHFNLRFCAPCPFPPSLRILTFAST